MTTLTRRTVLRGIGATLALPWMESVAFARPSASPTRLAYLYVPNGVHMQEWTPEAVGSRFELPPLLQSLSDFSDDFSVLSGLTADKARANGDGPGDHARAAAAFLTGVQPSKSDVRLGISADQIAARHIGSSTRLRSLEIGCEAGRQAGQCDSGYSCAYSSNISWQGERTPTLKETDPRLVFDRLLGRDLVSGDKREAKLRQSVLDLVRADAKRLAKSLGAADQEKLDEYLTGIRELERRIDHAMAGELEGVGETTRPEEHPKDYGEHIRIMFDLLVLAFRSDSTRVATFMLANEGSNRSYRNLEVSEGHHSLSHHGGKEDKIAQIKKINAFHLQQFAYFLERMREVEEGDGNLLDHSMIVYGSGISDGNRHNHDELPVLLAGRGGGLEPGRHVRVEAERPLNDLHIALLQRLGVDIDAFGDGIEALPL